MVILFQFYLINEQTAKLAKISYAWVYLEIN